MIEIAKDRRGQALKILIIQFIDIQQGPEEPIIHQRQEDFLMRHLMNKRGNMPDWMSLICEVRLGNLVGLQIS